jgi:HPt (histidine-containing phosphotransfer) domain-containing protein
MGELNENQLVLLDNLIYLNDVVNRENKNLNTILRDLLYRNGLKLSEKEKNGEIHYPGGMDRDVWITILKAIEKDPQLMNLTVKHGQVGVVYDKQGNVVMGENGKPLEVGARMATFVDSENNATVVFRGTSGDFEWHDNGTGGYLSDTQMQQHALEYVENLPYNNITVTGHSKGGNKAQYVGILSDKVDRVVSLDGQGFSQEFVEKYKDLIEANRHKITSISAENDFVNCLFIPVAGTIYYIDTEHQTSFVRNHSPGIVLDDNGNLRGEKDGQLPDDVQPGAIPRFINDFTIYLNANMKEPERSYVIDELMATLMMEGNQGFELEEGDQANELIKIKKIIEALAPSISGYFIENAGDGGKDLGGLLLASIGARAMPEEFMDDYLRYVKINAENVSFLVQLQQEIGGILSPIVHKKLSDYLADLAANVRDKAQEIGSAIAEFARKIQNGWNALVSGIQSSMEALKNAGIAAAQAASQFKDKVIQAVSDFCSWASDGIRRASGAAKNVLETAVDKVTNWSKKMKEEVTSTIGDLKNGVKRAFKLTQQGFKSLTGTVARKIHHISGGLLMVNLDRLSHLKMKLKRAEEDMLSIANRIVSDAERITSEVSRIYGEPSVQSQIRRLQKSIAEVRSQSRKVSSEIEQITRSLEKAKDKYRSIEQLWKTRLA